MTMAGSKGSRITTAAARKGRGWRRGCLRCVRSTATRKSPTAVIPFLPERQRDSAASEGIDAPISHDGGQWRVYGIVIALLEDTRPGTPPAALSLTLIPPCASYFFVSFVVRMPLFRCAIRILKVPGAVPRPHPSVPAPHAGVPGRHQPPGPPARLRPRTGLPTPAFWRPFLGLIPVLSVV